MEHVIEFNIFGPVVKVEKVDKNNNSTVEYFG